ncbi:protein kinase [Acidobacteria bacterium AH-259-D05]|nr:protein kinase [Acidobacteria bacterium AH-259-D05]
MKVQPEWSYNGRTDKKMTFPGLVEGRYKILEALGKDEIGATFLVEDGESGSQVALRSLRPSIVLDSTLSEALEREFEAAQNLLHPNVCALYEFCSTNEKRGALIIMEYVNGETLRDFLFKQPDYRCDQETFHRLADQILSAMEHAHRAGVTHRDLTPDNVMITTEGSIKVIDFGIDAIIKETHFKKWGNPIFLSTYYVSPEQIAGEDPGPSMDIYAMGCFFYEMLAGKLPFREQDIINREPDERADPISEISKELNDLILRCIESDKSNRPQSVEEIQLALATLRGEVIPQEEKTVAEKPPKELVLSEEAPVVEESPEEAWLSEEAPVAGVPPEEALLSEEAPVVGVPTEEDVLVEGAPIGEEPTEEMSLGEDLPLTVVQKKGSGRKVALISGFLVLIVGSFWWYQSGQVGSDLPVGVQGESTVGEPIQQEPNGPQGSSPNVPADVSQELQLAQPGEEVAGDQPDQVVQPSLDPIVPDEPPLEPQAPSSGSSQDNRPTEPPTRPPGSSLSDAYAVQVGAFGTEVAARKALSQLSAKGFSGRIEPPQGGADRYYRVLVGDFTSRDEASQFQTRLKADGFATFVKKISGQ